LIKRYGRQSRIVEQRRLLHKRLLRANHDVLAFVETAKRCLIEPSTRSRQALVEKRIYFDEIAFDDLAGALQRLLCPLFLFRFGRRNGQHVAVLLGCLAQISLPLEIHRLCQKRRKEMPIDDKGARQSSQFTLRIAESAVGRRQVERNDGVSRIDLCGSLEQSQRAFGVSEEQPVLAQMQERLGMVGRSGKNPFPQLRRVVDSPRLHSGTGTAYE